MSLISKMQSQFDTLEEPAADERPIIADAALTPVEMVKQVLVALTPIDAAISD